MVYIFHGSNPASSRQALNDFSYTFPQFSSLRLEGKEITQDLVNNHLNSTSLFADQKILILFDFFQLTAAAQKSIIPIIQKSDHIILIHAPKALTAAQLTSFPKAKVNKFSLSSTLFLMLSALKPNNSNNFYQLLDKTLKSEPVELIAYMIRRKLRELFFRSNGFPAQKLSTTYLALIDTDYQIKTGQIPLKLETLLINTLSRLL